MAGSFSRFSTDLAGLLDIASDAVTATKLTLQNSRDKTLRSWVLVPAGILAILAACFGVDALFRRVSVSFPASVACMLLLFAGLWVGELVVGAHRVRRAVAVIDVPAGWALRWISILFTPTFVTLPLSPPIGAAEVGKMIAVFAVGFVVMFVGTAYMTRGLQLLTGSHKKAQAARAEELGPRDDEVDLARMPPTPPHAPPQDDDNPSTMSTGVSTHTSAVALDELAPPVPAHGPNHIQPVAEHVGGSNSNNNNTPPASPPPPPPPAPLQQQAPPRARLWAAVMQRHLDTLTYLALLISVGLPVYYATGYAMPLHLAFTVLMYRAALALPPAWRQVLHPVIVSALLTVLGIWAFAAVAHHGGGLMPVLEGYTTGNKYLQLWRHATSARGQGQGMPPGAGDILSSVLDASIVGLALPMYQYRRELVSHGAAIAVPSVVLSAASLYAYPAACAAVGGISPPRALAFASRSLTLALAIPATANLGGDERTVAAVAIMSGVVGALVGGRVLGWLGIPEGDQGAAGLLALICMSEGARASI
ncbi:hypothetical protein KVR01_008099 [Diaporthe batatas]|uniref:uncharacterized protein n=1 Tax=Diaporthe batatas TaxID=748121 RepID=UPI001D051EF1|nr:uncharacterized protein KVR01_008099 [Diaporthe batatas]KAG8162334.1 hypothetical protein KVR01_008099 [Diaporthe batatas]